MNIFHNWYRGQQTPSETSGVMLMLSAWELHTLSPFPSPCVTYLDNSVTTAVDIIPSLVRKKS